MTVLNNDFFTESPSIPRQFSVNSIAVVSRPLNPMHSQTSSFSCEARIRPLRALIEYLARAIMRESSFMSPFRVAIAFSSTAESSSSIVSLTSLGNVSSRHCSFFRTNVAVLFLSGEGSSPDEADTEIFSKSASKAKKKLTQDCAQSSCSPHRSGSHGRTSHALSLCIE